MLARYFVTVIFTTLAGVGPMVASAATEYFEVDSLLHSGESRLDTGDAFGAEIVISEALMQGAKAPAAMTLLAEAYLKQGKLRSILEKLPMDGRKSLEASEVMGYQATALVALGRFDQAREMVATALGLQPLALMPRVAKTRLLINDGQHSEALALARSLTGRYPDAARAWNNLGLAAQTLKAHALAVDAYGRALELDAHLLQTRITRARLLVYMGRDEDSWDDLDFLEVHYPAEPRAAYVRALVLERAGVTRAAEDEFRRCASILSRLPEHWIAQSEQMTLEAATAHMRLGELESAREFLEAYQALDRDNPVITRKLASLLIQLQ